MRREYWWIVAQDDSGQKYLIFGSDRSSDDARQKGLEMGMGDFEIRKFPSRDIATCSHMLKYGIVERTRDISQAGKRLRHHSPDRYHRKRNL